MENCFYIVWGVGFVAASVAAYVYGIHKIKASAENSQETAGILLISLAIAGLCLSIYPDVWLQARRIAGPRSGVAVQPDPTNLVVKKEDGTVTWDGIPSTASWTIVNIDFSDPEDPKPRHSVPFRGAAFSYTVPEQWREPGKIKRLSVFFGSTDGPSGEIFQNFPFGKAPETSIPKTTNPLKAQKPATTPSA